MARQTPLALETARLLTKHRGFSAVLAPGILRSLALDLVRSAYDPDQLQTVWNQLEAGERLMPEVAIEASRRMLKVRGDGTLARSWLLPVWEHMLAQPEALTEAQRIDLMGALESGFALATGAPEAQWLTRIEQAQVTHPGDAALQYLAGMTCMRLQLWGKAQQLLTQSLPRLQDPLLERNAWAALAALAERRGDAAACAEAWQNAAKALNGR